MDQKRQEAFPSLGATSEIFAAFARLGCTSFGGPVAHIGYFNTEFVTKRQWLSAAQFADIVALCQFLPGPASSQVGFAIGLMRGGLAGALAAFAGFTLPSAIFLTLFALGAAPIAHSALGGGILHGLKLVAVSIVAQAVWGMARSLCPDRTRATIGFLSAVVMLLAPGPALQIVVILVGALAGLALCQSNTPAAAAGPLDMPQARTRAVVCLALFLALLLLPPLLGPSWSVFSAFYRSGALVFGGGHVVLPLLRDAVVTPGWVQRSDFLAGYGAAQSVPGPLFTFAAYLGAVLHNPVGSPSAGIGGAALALMAIFLPGFLLLLGILPFWRALRDVDRAQASLRGINAAVVGILGAALYTPVWTGAISGSTDVAVALLGFGMLVAWRLRPLLVVALGAASGVAMTFMG